MPRKRAKWGIGEANSQAQTSRGDMRLIYGQHLKEMDKKGKKDGGREWTNPTIPQQMVGGGLAWP